jgi:hypothetical protein
MYTVLVSKDILTILILPIHEHGSYFNFGKGSLLLFLSLVFCNFHCRCFLLLMFIPMYLIFVANVNGIVIMISFLAYLYWCIEKMLILYPKTIELMISNSLFVEFFYEYNHIT